MRAQDGIQAIGAQGEQLEREGRSAEAAQAYQRILTLDPKSIAALNHLGAPMFARAGSPKAFSFTSGRSGLIPRTTAPTSISASPISKRRITNGRLRPCNKPCRQIRPACKPANYWRLPTLGKKTMSTQFPFWSGLPN